MSRGVSFAIFLSVGTLIVAAWHYYLWFRLVRGAQLPPACHRAATSAVIALGLSIPLTFVVVALLRAQLPQSLAMAAYAWMGLGSIFLTLTLLSEPLRASLGIQQRLSGRSHTQNQERRLFLARLLSGAVTLSSLGFGAAALTSALRGPSVKRVRISLRRLPRSMSGTTIVQLSDLHLGPTLGREFMQEVVRRTNELKPDLIAITGDLVDGTVEALREAAAPLADLRATHGVFVVTGNHEYYSGADAWCRHLSQLGLRVLRNERVRIGNGEASFDLAGVEDFRAARRMGGRGPDLQRALRGRDESREVILLAHQPAQAYEASEAGVALQLSGHTHGGQIWPWNWLVRLVQPVVAGLGKVGNTLVYVNVGTGYWGPPMRQGAPSEITHIVLEREA